MYPLPLTLSFLYAYNLIDPGELLVVLPQLQHLLVLLLQADQHLLVRLLGLKGNIS